MSAVERAAEVLAEHHAIVGPFTGSWTCRCGELSINGSARVGDLTTYDERRKQYRAHVAAALAAAGCLRDDRPVYCMNCDADDLGCTACGAHGTLVAEWTRADFDARTDRLLPLADHLRVGHDVLPEERRYQDTWLHVALLAEEWFAASLASRDDREGVDLLDGSLDATVGAEGENPEAPTDHKVRDLAALAYLVVTCEALGVETDEEWDRFEFARAIHRRVRAVLDGRPPARDDRDASSDVEAVAETICEAHVGEGCRDWSDETEVWRETYRDMARAVLARIPCAARDDRRISVMDAIDALEAVFDAYDQAPALHPTAPPEHPAHLRAEGALRASEILRGRCRSAVVEALHTPDREGETVTEWGVRYSRDHEIEERTKESAMRARRQPTTARAFSRQRTRFPDIVTDWTPVTDGGDPS